VILVGDDPASHQYVGMKEKACRETGVASFTLRLPAGTPQDELVLAIGELNGRPDVHGILVQLPLPRQIDPAAIIGAIDPGKDVDGLHPLNMGRLMAGEECLVPCTPAGILALLKRFDVPLSGRNAVVIGRSNIVGKPTALLLMQENATVTICHSRTADLAGVVRRADIVVAAIGRARMITAEMVREGAAVVDVGTNRDTGGKLCGDVDYAGVAPKASAISPVPGGVGPMTITMLLHNTILAAARSEGTALP
jgi:methylenetetrahydrofolate dehydrogenase (NADP+)/methenyltetrahydrofolate cyclohydrolase